ncbi:FHA domain-containing protein [Methylomarinum sp. Ch1-1]|uniref:FHA domain-containing protein n=1 Tax=Methylomarinum roseum TaxID=3067653 RepID=A0AAU7NTJ4_9GAMM
MAKFTVYFKDKAINSDIFDSGVVHIGRDETNDVTVDSLAVAPAHAAVIIKDHGCIIKQLNDDFPLIINNAPTKEAVLQHNDRINIGKHSIVYSDTESITMPTKASDKDINYLNEKLEDNIKTAEANLQVMNGPHIGRILSLKKTMTRIGNNESGVVVISRRKEGYFIAALESSKNLAVNNQPLADNSVRLNDNDVITIDKISMQFFTNET